GAALMLGAGLAGSAAAALPKSLSVTQKAAKIVKAAMDTVEGSIRIVDTDRAHEQALAEGRVAEAEIASEGADEDLDEAIEMLSAELARMRRENEAVSEMSSKKHQTTQSVLDTFGVRER